MSKIQLLKFKYLLTLPLLFVIIGCGGGSNGPVLPGEDDNTGSHVLLGVWDITFDFDKMEAEVEENRKLIDEKNITMWLPKPSVTINSYNSETRIVDINLEITNPFKVDAYDPRVIVFADNQGRLLINPDQWTRLYAYTGGWLANPFKALALDIPDRMFHGRTAQNANLRVYLPIGADDITFAVNASYPGHCREPYKFENFRHTTINPQFKSSAFIEIEVYDWQDDVSALYLRCPEITDYPFSTFARIIDKTWGMYLINRRSAPPGDYKAILLALSENSGKIVLCDIINIKIVPDIKPPEWVSTVGITDVVAGNGEATVYWNMAVDPPNPPPIYYLLYIDTDNNPWDQTPVVRFWHNPYQFTGLTNGITYYFGIRAMDQANPPNIDKNNVILSAVPHH